MADDVRSLTGRQKAAIVIMAIGEERATKLFSLMDEEEIKELSQSMASLGSVNSKVVEALFVEFASQMSSTGSLVGSFDSTERLLRNTLPGDKVAGIMEEIRGPAGRTMWDKLSNVNAEVLANYFKPTLPRLLPILAAMVVDKGSVREP